MLGDRTNIQVVHPTNKAEPNSIVNYRVIIDTESRVLVKTKITIYEEPYGSIIDTYEETEYVSAYREIPGLSFIFPSSGFAVIVAETYVCTLTGCETTRDDMSSATINVTSGWPPPDCLSDNDCPEGQVCEDGECVDEVVVEDEWVEVARAEIGVNVAAGYGEWVEVARVVIGANAKGGVDPCIECDYDSQCRAGYVCSNEGCCVPDSSSPDCTNDDDCSEGYVCKKGECVEASWMDEIPWMWVGIGGAALAALALLIPKGKPQQPNIIIVPQGPYPIQSPGQRYYTPPERQLPSGRWQQ